MADVLVLNYNDAESTRDFVLRVVECDHVDHVLIVDNSSTDDSFEVLLGLCGDKVELVKSDKNGGYGYGNNLGIRHLSVNYDSKYILLANPDTIIEDSVIEELEEFLRSHNDFALAAPLMLDAQGSLQRNTAFRLPSAAEYILSLGMFYSKYWDKSYYSDILGATGSYKEVGAVSGALFMMNAENMLSAGMYDENIFLYCEETVLGLRLASSGYRTALLQGSSFVHKHSVSIKKTFKSSIDRHSLLLDSKMYVIRRYYGVSGLRWLLANVLKRISFAEAVVLGAFRRLL